MFSARNGQSFQMAQIVLRQLFRTLCRVHLIKLVWQLFSKNFIVFVRVNTRESFQRHHFWMTFKKLLCDSPLFSQNSAQTETNELLRINNNIYYEYLIHQFFYHHIPVSRYPRWSSMSPYSMGRYNSTYFISTVIFRGRFKGRAGGSGPAWHKLGARIFFFTCLNTDACATYAHVQYRKREHHRRNGASFLEKLDLELFTRGSPCVGLRIIFMYSTFNFDFEIFLLLSILLTDRDLTFSHFTLSYMTDRISPSRTLLQVIWRIGSHLLAFYFTLHFIL